MALRSLKFLLFFFSVISIAAVEIAFSPPQDENVMVNGRAVFKFNKYPNQKVKIVITEDEKVYKTIYSDDRGNFSANISLNHRYMFDMSMDYHGTSKVYIDTRVPEIITKQGTGAYFEFKCPLYERYQGLNMGILNRPLMKMKYIPKKDKFEFDKDYSKGIKIDMEGFIAKMDRLELENKDVLKDGRSVSPSNKKKSDAIASTPEKKKERKVIVFEEEKEKPVAENKRGHRNIMEVFEEKEAIPEVEEEIDPEEVFTSEIVVEESDEDAFVVLNVAPKRILIDESDSDQKIVVAKEKNESEKMKIREEEEVTRIEEQSKIREKVQSFNRMVYQQKIDRMNNEKILTDRLRLLLKTIAVAEIYVKKEDYKVHPIIHEGVIPSVLVKKSDNWWLDQEKIMVRYPNESTTFKKESYLFGITYYYIDGNETDEANFCNKVNSISKNIYACVN